MSYHWWVSVMLGLLSGDFICHGRCPYTTTPRGEIRHAAWLSLPLSIIAFALSSCARLCSLSPRQHSPFLLPSVSLSSISFSLPPPLLPPFSPVRSTEPRPWTGYRSWDRGSARISHATCRWAALSIQQECWQVIAWKTGISISSSSRSWQVSQ